MRDGKLVQCVGVGQQLGGGRLGEGGGHQHLLLQLGQGPGDAAHGDGHGVLRGGRGRGSGETQLRAPGKQKIPRSHQDAHDAVAVVALLVPVVVEPGGEEGARVEVQNVLGGRHKLKDAAHFALKVGLRCGGCA